MLASRPDNRCALEILESIDLAGPNALSGDIRDASQAFSKERSSFVHLGGE